MIALWYNGKYVDSWFNTMSDPDFMEVSMVNLALDPSLCEWVEYTNNPNGHNPKQVKDEDKSFDWIVDEIVPQATVVDPSEITGLQRSFYGKKVFEMLHRVLTKQKEILEANFLEPADIPAIPTQYAETVVTDKVVMNPMKTLFVQEEVFTKGERKKLYAGETDLPPKMEKIKDIAGYLLSKQVEWTPDFRNKIAELNKTFD